MVLRFVFLFSLFFGSRAESQICAEQFRSTPELQDVLNRPFRGISGGDAVGMDSPGPSESRLLNAARADVLNQKTLTSRAIYDLRRAFLLMNLDQALADDVLVEIQMRRFESALRKVGLPPWQDLRSLVRAHRVYLSFAIWSAATATVNFLSYKYLGEIGIIPYLPGGRLSQTRSIPLDVLYELVTTASDQAVPKTSAFARVLWSFRADAIVNAMRRAANVGLLAALFSSSAAFIAQPDATLAAGLDTATSEIRELARQENRETLALAKIKRDEFLATRQFAKAAAAEKLMADLEESFKAIK